MPVTKIQSKWNSSGNLVFFSDTVDPIATFNNTDGLVLPAQHLKGTRFTINSQELAAADFPVPLFIAPAPCKVISAYESHGAIGNTSLRIDLEVLNSTLSAGNGTTPLNGSFNGTSAIDTPVSLNATSAGIATLAAGGRLGAVSTGAPLNYATGQITITMEWL